MATNEISNEYPLPKDSYAAFDAISLRNLIIQRLNDQNVFTDQNYIGSNLACIIDIVSYAFNTLMFYLNKTSNESMFTEAQLYENISRIVKLLDYKPIGYQTSTLAFQCSAQGLEEGFYTIPRYSYLMIGNVPFSFNEDVSFAVPGPQTTELSDLSNKKLLYQGIYRENPLYTALGDPNEVVTINISNVLVDHFNVDVYVYEIRQNRWIQYTGVTSLYNEQAFSRTFEKRLNSNLLYEITFGDGINGRMLEEGDQVAIYYLQSSGEQGVVGPGQILTASKSIYNTSVFDSMLQDINNEQLTYLNSNQFTNLFFNNVVGSTTPKQIEDADTIRKNAPANFKSQYRLVTKADYETFIKTNFSNFVNDVKVFSNWDYTGRYLKYFNDIGVSPTSYRQLLLNQVLYADSCNFNNVYICCVPRVSLGSSLKYLLPAQKEAILSNVEPVKIMTSEVTFLDPIFKAISIGVKTNNEVNVNDKDFCRVEIIRSVNSKRSIRSIGTDIQNVFQIFFNPVNAKLGGIFLYDSLISNMLAVEGVGKIQTRRLDTNEKFDVLSLFMWNPNYPDLDKQAIVNNVELQEFELVYYDNLQGVFSQIEVFEQESDIGL